MAEEQNDPLRSHRAAGRAIDELRRQAGVVIYERQGRAIGNYPIESIDENIFNMLRPHAFGLLLTAARAQALGLADQDIRLESHGLAWQDIRALGDPLAPPVSLPAVEWTPASAIDTMALVLAKHASLLPALLLVDGVAPAASDWLRLDAADLKRYLAAPLIGVERTAEAALPMEGAENSTLISFRERYGATVHLALVIGRLDPAAPPLTRIHSSCVTGDILGSLRCDCGDQLTLAMEALRREGSGVLIYLHEEGRGIGIANKLRAYRLQERGADTYAANRMLGFEEDERDFAIAAAILEALGIGRIRLLTNNPRKIAALEKSRIAVTERMPLVSPSGKHNHAYLETKSKKAGHLF